MTAPSFPPTLPELRSELAELADWDERYDYLIDLGRQLQSLDDAHRMECNLVHGCMSTVWLVAQVNLGPPVTLEILADSDSLIVKGLIVVLLALFNRRTPEGILTADPDEVFKELGLHQHLSPQRRNGLYAMVKRIQQLAVKHLTEASNPSSISNGFNGLQP
ncbi:MAG TPA: SufE family protein [Pirellulaceae bacterium]|nr:SufE family protein [Pirellulaceae bacterium]